jgi:hypothetical protein
LKPVIAVNVAHQRPIDIEVVVARSNLARATRALDIVLQGEKEKSGAVRWHFNTRPWIFASQIQPVVIRANYIVISGELCVSAKVNCVLLCRERLFQGICYFRCADRQRHFERFAARVVVALLGCDAQIG